MIKEPLKQVLQATRYRWNTERFRPAVRENFHRMIHHRFLLAWEALTTETATPAVCLAQEDKQGSLLDVPFPIHGAVASGETCPLPQRPRRVPAPWQFAASVSFGKEVKHWPCCTDTARALHGFARACTLYFSTRPCSLQETPRKNQLPLGLLPGAVCVTLQSKSRAGPGSQAESVRSLRFWWGQSQGLEYTTSSVLARTGRVLACTKVVFLCGAKVRKRGNQ